MAKKTTQKAEKQPSFIEELLQTGSAVLKARTLDELAEAIDNIPADVHYAAGAVGRSFDEGVYTLRIDSLNK